jgi:hypothetical protein
MEMITNPRSDRSCQACRHRYAPNPKHARNLTMRSRTPTGLCRPRRRRRTILWCATIPIGDHRGRGGRLITSFYTALPGLAELFARSLWLIARPRVDYQP